MADTAGGASGIQRGAPFGAVEFELTGQREMVVSQKFELMETFSFETRNRYWIVARASGLRRGFPCLPKTSPHIAAAQGWTKPALAWGA